MLIVTPALVAWFRRGNQFRLTPWVAAEFALMAAGWRRDPSRFRQPARILVGQPHRAEGGVSLVIWAAVRFGRRRNSREPAHDRVSIGTVILAGHGGANAATLLDSLEAVQLRLLTLAPWPCCSPRSWRSGAAPWPA